MNQPDDRRDAPSSADHEYTSSEPVPRDAEWDVAVQSHYEQGSLGGLTATIVCAVADAEGVSPRDIKSPPLYEVVDTAALELAFFGSEENHRVHDSNASTEFMYRGYRIVVQSDGWVHVYEQTE